MIPESAAPARPFRTIRWKRQSGNDSREPGLEHLLLGDNAASGVLLAADDDDGPFTLQYHLSWNESWSIAEAVLHVVTERYTRSLVLRRDGNGHWRDGDGNDIAALEGCTDIDIWPTPFTNTFPMRRAKLKVGERMELRAAWVFAPTLAVKSQQQAYTCLAEGRYLFENLDGSGFRAELSVDEDCVVVDYPGLFSRIPEGQSRRT